MRVSVGEDPLVTVLTPVYNGETYLAVCIESVLAQTYSNWHYIIVNNNSTDRTLEIAERYARADSRIEVHTYDVLVGVIENHNRAFRLVPDEAKYCKIVSGDDWLFPECLSRMVAVAKANPSVGIVGSYQLSGARPRDLSDPLSRGAGRVREPDIRFISGRSHQRAGAFLSE